MTVIAAYKAEILEVCLFEILRYSLTQCQGGKKSEVLLPISLGMVLRQLSKNVETFKATANLPWS